MNRKSILPFAVAGVYLASAACSSDSTDSNRLAINTEQLEQVAPQTSRVSGTITDLMRDSFPIYGGGGNDGGAAQFNYQIAFIDDGRNTKKILFPQPTTYREGDNVAIEVIDQSSISFQEMSLRYARRGDGGFGIGIPDSLQLGSLSIDGILAATPRYEIVE